jgi:hypothetical protein
MSGVDSGDGGVSVAAKGKGAEVGAGSIGDTSGCNDCVEGCEGERWCSTVLKVGFGATRV